MLEEGAEAEVWERYASPDDERRAAQRVVELIVGHGADLRYVCEPGHLRAAPGSSPPSAPRSSATASLDWAALGFGSARGKVRMETKLAGPGLRGAGHRRLRRRRPASTSTTTRRRSTRRRTPTSDLAFRGVLAAGATAVWRGMIKVDPGAQQTDAFQESRNLLLSTEAHADAIPGLEIEADDVRCTHAAAVAQIDREQLFYLTSRGLDDADGEAADHRGLPRVAGRAAREGPIREKLAAALEARLERLLDGA